MKLSKFNSENEVKLTFFSKLKWKMENLFEINRFQASLSLETLVQQPYLDPCFMSVFDKLKYL